MKYYLLRTVSDPKIVGVTDGGGQVELDANNPITEELKNFFFFASYWNEKRTAPNFDVRNCTATIVPKAKLTDFLNFSPALMTCPFMISERLAEVFASFKVQKYYTYPVTLSKEGMLIPDKYFLFCCPFLGYEVINFPESVFYTKKSLFDKERNYIHYKDEKDFSENYIVSAKIEKLVLNSNFDSSLDYFKTRVGEIYISEGLKDAIEVLGFTGVSIFDDKEPLIVV
ncbi:hypothetical protein [Niabella drilacis]|uniref:Uncharacterized protein n=1 Tax=Niabella drilacis (strain DSM 25811 / CCM 8410 / CCUG 62505 / LMG 26954 / E90) TaxID=1285928 RepID=A0A1G6URP9_NIADE|nr:hypothetical protein [Niabella drilacis]SDD44068.1 hypothetical protein SAMN04487894_10971 [Niabella drilacis]